MSTTFPPRPISGVSIYYFKNTFQLQPLCFWIPSAPSTPCTWDSARGVSVLLWVIVFCKISPKKSETSFSSFPWGSAPRPPPSPGPGRAALATEVAAPACMSGQPPFLCVSLSSIHVFRNENSYWLLVTRLYFIFITFNKAV